MFVLPSFDGVHYTIVALNLSSPLHETMHLAVILALLFAPALAVAQSAQEDKPSRVIDTWEAPSEWKEKTAVLPDPPEESTLVPMLPWSIDTRHEYFLDRSSLAVRKDGIFVYTVVIRSPTGASNAFYEGLRCKTKMVKTYGYLSGDQFYESSKPQWEPVAAQGVYGYRAILLREYVCSRNTYGQDEKVLSARARPIDEILAIVDENSVTQPYGLGKRDERVGRD